MEYPSKAFPGATPVTGSRDRFLQLPDDWRLARAAHEEFRRMGMPDVNLLLVGASSMTRRLVGMLLRERADPIATWGPGEPFQLPPIALGGTVVLYDVGALSREDQRHLLDWLEHAVGRTQVISTASEPLLPHVHAGAFIETLFYRLNIVCLDVTG